jgi:hypothetical protein
MYQMGLFNVIAKSIGLAMVILEVTQKQI